MKGFADTGFIVAFGNRDDGHHASAMEVAKNIMIRPAELAEISGLTWRICVSSE
jgi:hypothetical protein